MHQSSTRRAFVVRALGVLASGALFTRAVGAAGWGRARSVHPTPRPGITADKVLKKEQLASTPALIPVFQLAREIPEVIDGIRCNCGCAELAGYYSLLSCYEGDAMALHCEICRAQVRLAHRMHKAGRSLDAIRKGIDARFG